MYLRGAFLQWMIVMAISVVMFPICCVVVGFSGCDLRRRGDKHACNDGAVEKCLAVGQYYEARTDGLFATMLSNASTAKNYYGRACKLGSVPGCARFGHMMIAGSYDAFHDSEFTRADGMAGLKTACDGGDRGACHELADALDPAEAAPVLAKLCDGGDKPSCEKLSGAYLATDPKKAAEFLAQKCDAGDNDSCRKLGTALLVGGTYGDADPARGIAVLTKACDRSSWGSCRDLGEAYTDGTLPADPARAGELFAKACEHDDPDACFDAGKVLVETDPAKSVQLFTSNCDKGDQRGCDALGDMTRVGTDATPRDRAKAHAIYDRACRAGNDFDCHKRDCMDSSDAASDACYKVHKAQKEYVYKLGGRFDMR